MSDALLDEILAVTMAADPDLILLTGDYVEDDPAPIHPLSDRLRLLTDRYPGRVFASLGNHDIKVAGAREEIIAALSDAGVGVLWNQTVFPLGSRTDLALVGFADRNSGEMTTSVINSLLGDPDQVYGAAADQVCPDGNNGTDPISAATNGGNQPVVLPASTPRLVLTHNPDTLTRLRDVRVDLALCGHTHGGQVALFGVPVLRPVCWAVNTLLPRRVARFLPGFFRSVKHWEWASGLFRFTAESGAGAVGGQSLAFTSRGLGAHLFGRLWCPPEVAIITLVRS